MRKNLSFLLILLSLLFNIQVGFTHDIEHQYHDDVHNKNLIECEDCTFIVTDHSAKTISFS